MKYLTPYKNVAVATEARYSTYVYTNIVSSLASPQMTLSRSPQIRSIIIFIWEAYSRNPPSHLQGTN